MSPTSYRTAPPRAKLNSFPKDFQRPRDNDFKSEIRNRKSKMPLVGLGRVELPTSRLSGVRSNQLSYRPLVFSGPHFNAKKSHTSLLPSVETVDALEGRVASVANTACDLRSCQIVKDQLRFQSEISNLKSQRTQSLNTR